MCPYKLGLNYVFVHRSCETTLPLDGARQCYDPQLQRNERAPTTTVDCVVDVCACNMASRPLRRVASVSASSVAALARAGVKTAGDLALLPTLNVMQLASTDLADAQVHKAYGDWQ